MLVYRLFRCCNKLTAKILHTFLNLMAVPCIVVATIAVFDSHNLRDPPIPNLYSLHSWLGLVTIGLFALQVTHTVRQHPHLGPSTPQSSTLSDILRFKAKNTFKRMYKLHISEKKIILKNAQDNVPQFEQSK